MTSRRHFAAIEAVIAMAMAIHRLLAVLLRSRPDIIILIPSPMERKIVLGPKRQVWNGESCREIASLLVNFTNMTHRLIRVDGVTIM